MSKQFKEVAHLYVGCPLDSGRDITLNARRLDEILNDERDSKPILRRLESMTEEEALQYVNIGIGPVHAFASIRITHLDNDVIEFRDGYLSQAGVIAQLYKRAFDELSPDDFLWLLSKSFDLFGLIESNQAIDAATLPA